MNDVRFVVRYDAYGYDSLDYLDQWDTREKYERDGAHMVPDGNGGRRELDFDDYERSFGDKDNYTVYVVEKQVECKCCGSWNSVDTLGGCAEYFGPYMEMQTDTLSDGTYTYEELPDWVRGHFTAEPVSDLV